MKQPTTFKYIKASLIACIIGVIIALLALQVVTKTVTYLKKDIDEENPPKAAVIKKTGPISRKPSATSTLYIERAAQGLPLTIKSVSLTADAYLASTLDSEYPLTELDADKLMPIASITKLVTAVIADVYLDPNLPVTMTDEILATEGMTGKFRKGSILRVNELMYPLLMVSSNDAAEAIARSSNSRDIFIEKMNTWAKSIGAIHTHFEDPSGLSPNNVSTARDLLVIMKWIQKNRPQIFEITKLKTKTIRMYTWVGPTHFLNMTSYLGGKNGFTDEADRTAASLFSVKGKSGLTKTVAVIILHSEKRDEDVMKLLRFSELTPL